MLGMLFKTNNLIREYYIIKLFLTVLCVSMFFVQLEGYFNVRLKPNDQPSKRSDAFKLMNIEYFYPESNKILLERPKRDNQMSIRGDQTQNVSYFLFIFYPKSSFSKFKNQFRWSTCFFNTTHSTEICLLNQNTS